MIRNMYRDSDTDSDSIKESNKGVGVENWKQNVKEKDTLDNSFINKVKNNDPLHENDDETVAIDDTEIIVPKTPEVKDSFQNVKEQHTSGKVGKNNDASKFQDQDAKMSNTSGLYTMSIIFYLGLLVVVVFGGWLLGCKRTHHNNGDDKRSSRLPSIWKEREDSMMKLL